MDRLGDYLIEAEIGRGGMGRVYKARHATTGAVRALKVIAGAAGPEAVARFQREAEALARAGARIAVPIHETGQAPGCTFYTMDLMPGGSLKARLEGRGKLPWREAAEIVRDLARATARCHDLGLVHRDLKPANVLFDEEGAPRLADFGCVRDLEASTLTETGVSLGTPEYMAPEQLDGGRGEARSDVYALGAILYELATGTLPHAGRTWRELLLAKRRAPPGPVAAALGAPEELDAILARALAPELKSRTGSASQLARELGLAVALGVALVALGRGAGGGGGGRRIRGQRHRRRPSWRQRRIRRRRRRRRRRRSRGRSLTLRSARIGNGALARHPHWIVPPAPLFSLKMLY